MFVMISGDEWQSTMRDVGVGAPKCTEWGPSGNAGLYAYRGDPPGSVGVQWLIENGYQKYFTDPQFDMSDCGDKVDFLSLPVESLSMPLPLPARGQNREGGGVMKLIGCCCAAVRSLGLGPFSTFSSLSGTMCCVQHLSPSSWRTSLPSRCREVFWSPRCVPRPCPSFASPSSYPPPTPSTPLGPTAPRPRVRRITLCAPPSKFITLCCSSQKRLIVL